MHYVFWISVNLCGRPSKLWDYVLRWHGKWKKLFANEGVLLNQISTAILSVWVGHFGCKYNEIQMLAVTRDYCVGGMEIIVAEEM